MRSSYGGWLNLIPCAVSSVRIAIGLAFPWLPPDWRLPLAFVAALTDLIDGPISRWLHVDGKFGQIFDPIADKIFLAGVLATVLLDGHLPWWELALVGTRDVAVLVASSGIALCDGASAWQHMRPRHLGKMTTAVQVAFVFAYCSDAELLTHGAAFAAAILGGAATVDYFVAYRARAASIHRLVDQKKLPPPNAPGSPPPNCDFVVGQVADLPNNRGNRQVDDLPHGK